MKIKGQALTRQANKLKSFTKYLILICISAALLFPVVYMFSNSFMSSREVIQNYSAVGETVAEEGKAPKITFSLIPDTVSFMQYYNVLLRKPKFLLMFWNSVIFTLPIMLGQSVVSAMAAYAFSKLKFQFSNKIFFYIL